MTTKRTHGPCSVECQRRSSAIGSHVGHQPDCPSLYPAQQEPDALTRLARLIRQMQEEQLQRRTDALAEQALTLISEAREEQRKARSDGLKAAMQVCREEGQSTLASCIEDLLSPPEEP